MRKKLVDESITEAVDERKDIDDDIVNMVQTVHEKFIAKQVQNFPNFCQEAYVVNAQNDQINEKYGKKGKYTDSFGWSEDRTFKSKWIVPQNLHLFMQNLVYIDFWADSNSRVRDSFMKRVCKGGTRYEYDQLLKKVLFHYGANIKSFGKDEVNVVTDF